MVAPAPHPAGGTPRRRRRWACSTTSPPTRWTRTTPTSPSCKAARARRAGRPSAHRGGVVVLAGLRRAGRHRRRADRAVGGSRARARTRTWSTRSTPSRTCSRSMRSDAGRACRPRRCGARARQPHSGDPARHRRGSGQPLERLQTGAVAVTRARRPHGRSTTHPDAVRATRSSCSTRTCATSSTALWQAGAEAISINGQRLTTLSAIRLRRQLHHGEQRRRSQRRTSCSRSATRTRCRRVSWRARRARTG